LAKPETAPSSVTTVESKRWSIARWSCAGVSGQLAFGERK